MFRRDLTSCGGVDPSDLTRALARDPVEAGPADGPRARYGVQSSNRCFSCSSVQTGARASAGVTAGEKNVEQASRQAAGASNEAAVVPDGNHLPGGYVSSTNGREGPRPDRLMRTLPSNLRVS